MVKETDAHNSLLKAFKDAENHFKNKMVPTDKYQFIDTVLDSKALTYKYILFTALLSKTADNEINPLCLQKKSELPGAYDARSICHKVIVPFEQTTLDRVLGGSNEPFLNKPARVPQLSKENPVREGNDKVILLLLCNKLSSLNNSPDDAYDLLVYFLFKLLIKKEEKSKLKQSTFLMDRDFSQRVNLLSFIDSALDKNFGGEILTLITAGVYFLQYQNDDEMKIEVHPVNQAGSSSKEISDLDIYKNGKLFIANELKDKIFDDHDVNHACQKVIENNGEILFFIVGPRGIIDRKKADILEEDYLKQGFILSITYATEFLKVLIKDISKPDLDSFIRYIISTAMDTKFKEDTINYLHELSVNKK